MTKVFISHASSESRLANYLTNWMKKLPGVEAFCSSLPEDLTSGKEWLPTIINQLQTCDICMVLLSLDNIQRQWLFFEAGLASAKDDHKLVPVLYGGIKNNQLPGPLQSRQTLDFSDPSGFDNFIKKNLAPNGQNFHQDFTDNMPESAGRIQKYGLYGGIVESAEIENPGKIRLEAPDTKSPNQTQIYHDINRYENSKEIVAVRIRAIARRTESNLWKFGIRLQKGNENPVGNTGRMFEFHAGCHENFTMWTIYQYERQINPFNIPALLQTDEEFGMEIWLDSNKKTAICIGIGTDGNRVPILNDRSDVGWKVDSWDDWDHITIKAWVDNMNEKCVIEIDELEIHRA